MFGLFKAKNIEIVSPVAGEAVSLESVNDEVFSQKMLGDGVAIIPTDEIFCAPISGTISKIFSTNHAFSIRNDEGVEVLVHIGLDTVELRGEGFERLAGEDGRVKAGDAVIRADLNYLQAQGKEIVTPVVITDRGKSKSISKNTGIVQSGDLIMELA